MSAMDVGWAPPGGAVRVNKKENDVLGRGHCNERGVPYKLAS